MNNWNIGGKLFFTFWVAPVGELYKYHGFILF